MKKIVLTVVTVMTFTFGFAETTPGHRMLMDREPVSYDMSFDMRRLAAKLDLTAEQMETMEAVQICFNNDMQEASTSKGLQRRYLIHQAVRKDAQRMRRVLNDEQFSTYMMLLGTTLRNKGL